MVLRRVLQELEMAQGPVDLSDLGRKLGVERSALEGMIAFWVRKGRLKDDYLMCLGGDCGESCSGASCPLLRKLPRSFSLPDGWNHRRAPQ